MAIVVDGGIEFGGGDNLVDEAPIEGLLGADGFAEPEHFAGAAVADDHGEPLGCAARRDGAARCANLANGYVVGCDCKVAGNVELVATADDHAVQAGDGGLADVAETVVRFDECAHPFPVVGALLEELLLL